MDENHQRKRNEDGDMRMGSRRQWMTYVHQRDFPRENTSEAAAPVKSGKTQGPTMV